MNKNTKPKKFHMMINGALFSVVSFFLAQTAFANQLSLKEVNLAKSIVFHSMNQKSPTQSEPRVLARNASLTNSIPQQELLLVERKKNKKNKTKSVVRTYYYDYIENKLVISDINLDSNQILQQFSEENIQLPLNQNEVNRAKALIFDDAEEFINLNNQYTAITGNPLFDVSKINIKASIFRAVSMPNKVNEATKSCGIDRCAKLMLFTHGNTLFEISPIINLSKGMVTQWVGM